MADDIQAKIDAAVRPVTAIELHPDLARCIIHWLGRYIEFTRQPGQPGVPVMLMETQKALADAVAAIDNSRQRELDRSLTPETIISGHDRRVGTDEAAAELGISADAVRWHCRKGNLDGRRVGRQVMVAVSSIEDFKRRRAERSV